MRSRSAGWCARRHQRAAHNPPDGLNGGLLGPLRGVVRSFYQPATIPLAGGVPTTPSDVVGIRSPKAVPSSRGCGRRVVPNRRWRRQWRSRRRVAAPRSLAFSGQTAPSNEGLEQTSLGPSLRSGPDREAAQSHVVGATTTTGLGRVRTLRGRLARGPRSTRGCELSVGLARSPSGHFASAVAAGSSDDGIFVVGATATTASSWLPRPPGHLASATGGGQ